MSSQINTNSIDVNYPVPGQNNSSQGFRTNFAGIKNNLDTAASEISDLQSKVIVKSALTGQTLDNDMNGALIKNALTQGFRSVVYNLGTNLSGSVVVDCSLGNVQIGSITGNVQISFSNWPPVNTESVIQLDLTFLSSTATVTFPTEVKISGNFGAETLQNFRSVGGQAVISCPVGVTRLELQLVTQDCGTSISIEPKNISRQATQIVFGRSPTNVGSAGDRAGAICVDSNYLYMCIGTWDGTTQIWRRIALQSY